MKKERKPKYIANPETGELHRLPASGSCHIGENWPEYRNLKEVKEAAIQDRCGHCFGLKKPKPASVQEGVI